jgi:excisionase family DNA binding protein
LKLKNFDPLAYIESAFLDSEEKGRIEKDAEGNDLQTDGTKKTSGTARKFRRTEMSAPRPRRAGKPTKTKTIDPKLQDTWQNLPKNIEFLCSFYDDSVTSNYYRGEFKESREDLIRRLLNPELSLEEISRLLGVCPATIRRYTNREWLTHHRTKGGQRRFWLSDVVKFVEEHGRFPEE